MEQSIVNLIDRRDPLLDPEDAPAEVQKFCDQHGLRFRDYERNFIHVTEIRRVPIPESTPAFSPTRIASYSSPKKRPSIEGSLPATKRACIPEDRSRNLHEFSTRSNFSVKRAKDQQPERATSRHTDLSASHAVRSAEGGVHESRARPKTSSSSFANLTVKRTAKPGIVFGGTVNLLEEDGEKTAGLSPRTSSQHSSSRPLFRRSSSSQTLVGPPFDSHESKYEQLQAAPASLSLPNPKAPHDTSAKGTLIKNESATPKSLTVVMSAAIQNNLAYLIRVAFQGFSAEKRETFNVKDLTCQKLGVSALLKRAVQTHCNMRFDSHDEQKRIKLKRNDLKGERRSRYWERVLQDRTDPLDRKPSKLLYVEVTPANQHELWCQPGDQIGDFVIVNKSDNTRVKNAITTRPKIGSKENNVEKKEDAD
ncbi:MAG: hypothetical protein Q9227_009570 [Pyrenula ochraceoflavens]